MSEQRLYPTEMTPEEAALGFAVREIENPSNRWGDDPFGEPHLLRAVAAQVTPAEWVFKMNMLGQTRYSRQRYGLRTKLPIVRQARPEDSPYTSDLPEWCVVDDSGAWPRLPSVEELRTPSANGDVHARIPPVVVERDGKRYLCHPAGQVPDRYVRRHEGVEFEVDGLKVVGFEVVG